MDRRDIIKEVLKSQYPDIEESAVVAVAREIDEHWHILKRKATTGVDNEWSLAGHIQSFIWGKFGGGAQSAAAAHRILRRLAEEKSRDGAG